MPQASLRDLVKKETGVSAESITLDQEALTRELPELRRIIEHVAIAEKHLDAARAKEKDCDRNLQLNSERISAADVDLKAIRPEAFQEVLDNPDASDIPGLAGRITTRLALCNFLASLQEFIAETVKPQLSIETLKAFAELSAWQHTQYTLAARVCQRQLNVAMLPAVLGGDVLAEPYSSGILELEDGARQTEYALQAAREALRNAESAYAQQVSARNSFGSVRRPIYT